MDTTLLHAYGPWVLLIVGTVSLLVATLFWDICCRLNKGVLNLLGKVLAAGPKEKPWFVQRYNELVFHVARRSMELAQTAAARWLTATLSLVYIAAAALWFAWRP